jgi:uncharacterized protein (DUF58 family)
MALTRLAHALGEADGNARQPPETALKPSDMLVWLSDFLSPVEETEARLRALAREGARGILVAVADPAEEDFPFAGRTRFEAADIRETALVGRAETIAAQYRPRYETHFETLGRAVRAAGWSLLRHRTDKSPAAALIALYGALGGPRAQRGF